MMRTRMHVGAWCAVTAAMTGCASAPPELTGFAVNTPETYSENKVFFTQAPSEGEETTQALLPLEHLYEIEADDEFAIKPNDPVSVVLQGVRLPEDLGAGTRDIAVVLDINTSVERGATTLVAFYQRAVPAGQMLNFNNLLVYADPMWDDANPPYFRVRVLDVKAERNRRTGLLLDRVSNLSAQISGLVPHPVIPIVTTAIDVAGLVLRNQENEVLLDYQIQFYGERHRAESGSATLGSLRAGQWIVLGRARAADSSFWDTDMALDRRTDRILREATVTTTGEDGGERTDSQMANVPVPYVSVAIVRADAEAPKLVLDRSEAMLALLSTPGGKSDIDGLEQAMSDLSSAMNAYAVERRLRRYRSISDIEAIIEQLRKHDTGEAPLNTYELRRLMYVLDGVTEVNRATPEQWVSWWNAFDEATLDEWGFESDASSRFGVVFRERSGEDGS